MQWYSRVYMHVKSNRTVRCIYLGFGGNMLTQFSRTELLLGKEAMEKLKKSRVAVFGIGGVGGYVCEALVRSGVGAFDLIDDDKVEVNRM